jgi:hypothetical protein
LLDTHLVKILPPIVSAFLIRLAHKEAQKTSKHVDLQSAVCTLLYTLCKVRGQKIIVGFFNNEPKYLEPILVALENTLIETDSHARSWQVHYVLLLWLSHLLLTPFDLSSISASAFVVGDVEESQATFLQRLPPLTARILQVGLSYISSSTKAQDAAAMLIVRLIVRPDVQELRLGDWLLDHHLALLHGDGDMVRYDLYAQIGSLRLLGGCSSANEVSHLIPRIFGACQALFDTERNDIITSNAVGKKLAVKVFRNVAILSLKSATLETPLLEFVQSSVVVESVIDYLLRSLGDKDTPVRLAAAKAISLIILEVGQEMGHEIVEAILETLKEDIPRSSVKVDLTSVDPLKWHGLILALAHALFKRSASPLQLPDILKALFTALQFQQRTATGTLLGTNVRDAANFGIWSLARRYTSAELATVDHSGLSVEESTNPVDSVIQLLAIQLLLSACLDPAGNIRRGSSAALQELIGRHPNILREGISLIQVVDYQAVGLRHRAMVDVARQAASLDPLYWSCLVEALQGWRGLRSADVPSRESAAASIAMLWVAQPAIDNQDLTDALIKDLQARSASDVEAIHGDTLTLASILHQSVNLELQERLSLDRLWTVLDGLRAAFDDFNPRLMRSELPKAVIKFITELCKLANQTDKASVDMNLFSCDKMDRMAELLFTRHEEWIITLIPDMVAAQLQYMSNFNKAFPSIDPDHLSVEILRSSSKSSLHGAGRAIALGTIALSAIPEQSRAQSTAAVQCLADLMRATNVDWRIIGAKSLQLTAQGLVTSQNKDKMLIETICSAIRSGLKDYTIDERGDIGSLVRIEAIKCASSVLAAEVLQDEVELQQGLESDICRLSLEKLDRVRMQAAQCRSKFVDLDYNVTDVLSISTAAYFEAALAPLLSSPFDWKRFGLLSGCISCAGTGAEALLQAARAVLADNMIVASVEQLERFMSDFTGVLKGLLDDNITAIHPALELLAFTLRCNLANDIFDSQNVKWRSLLLTVQKSHFKSNDIPRIIAAVQVYTGLAQVANIREEVLKKLFSMLKTNPYPRVRFAVADALWVVTGNEALKAYDATLPAAKHAALFEQLSVH